MATPLKELQSLLRSNYQADRAVHICGEGSKGFLSKPRLGERLEMASLSGIIQYEPSELVVTAWAGTPLTELVACLAERGQGLLWEPPLFDGRGTIGGMVASNLAGPARAYKGGVRDYVLGLQLLRYDGEPLRFGGAVMKNVAGFDVSRLLVGSMGYCGPITAVTLKVMPLPKAELTLSRQMTQADALSWFCDLAQQPLPISATSWWQDVAMVRLSGQASVVTAAQTSLASVAIAVDRMLADIHWRSLRDQTHEVFVADTGKQLYRLSLPLNCAPVAQDETLVEWGGGLRWVRSAKPLSQWQQWVRPLGGSVTVWPCELVQETSSFEPALAALQEKIRQVYDPKGLYNQTTEAPWKPV